MTKILIPLEFLDLLAKLIDSWVEKYALREEDIDLCSLILLGIYGEMPPARKEPQSETRQLSLFSEYRKEA